MTPEELPAYLTKIKDRLAAEGPSKAADAMARRFHEYVADDILVRSSHTRGSKTPSGPGQPPALVSGALKRSLRWYPAVPAGAYRARSRVRPSVIYARIQELGGTIRAPHLRREKVMDANGKMVYVWKGYLSWVGEDGRHFAVKVHLPARPYMRPGHRDTVKDGSLRRAAAEAVRKLVTG